MQLFRIIAKWADAEGIENQDLYVRAEDDTAAFILWANYYDKNEVAAYTEDMAEEEYDVEWEIKELKTYADPKPEAGVIQWVDFERLLIEAL